MRLVAGKKFYRLKGEMPQEGIYGYIELFLINLFYFTFQLL